jgi:RecA/RadA recombinase
MSSDENFSGLMTAEKYYERLKAYPALPSGDQYLDTLLGGGFRKGLVHLLIGPRKKNTEILLRTAVKSFMPKSNNGLNMQKVAYIDGNNRFNPYYLSQLAQSMNMNPREILNNIYVARAFNWSQMVEIAEIKLTKMQGVGLILIDGLTSMFEDERGLQSTEQNTRKIKEDSMKSIMSPAEYSEFPPKPTMNLKAYEDLKSAINGIKKAIAINEPIVIITAPKHPQSLHKPVGGTILTHFGCVIVEILQTDRFTEYILAQHPFMPQKRVVRWNSIEQQMMARHLKWDNTQDVPDIYEQSKDLEQPRQPTRPDEKPDTIQMPPSDGFIKEVMNLRLKQKRNKAAQKNEQDKRKNQTLDFFLEK